MKIIRPPLQQLNLYIDESGYYYIGQSHYRYFILTAVVIKPDQRELADKLFMKWRKKHLMNPYRCLHATDYFENRGLEGEYAKPELSIKRNFDNSVKELMEFISYIDFKAKVFFVDLPSIRRRLKIDEPPIDPDTSEEEKLKYKAELKNYSKKLKETLKDTRFAPIDMSIIKAYEYHNEFLNPDGDSNSAGYINIESHQESDIRLINAYHKFGDLNPAYKTDILGINLHTKRSLDSGIELADLISYVSCQTLRFSHRIKNELKDIPENRHEILKDIRTDLRGLGITLSDITNDRFKYKKN